MNIAICLRGFLRTWDFTKNHIFELFSNLKQCNIVWFLDTWDIQDRSKYIYSEMTDNTVNYKENIQQSYLNLLSLEKDFSNKNYVINVHKFDTQLNSAESFLKISYLTKITRQSYESNYNIKFDVVVLWRPDVILHPIETDLLINGILSSKNIWALNYINGIDINNFISKSSYALNSEMKTVATSALTPSDTIFYGSPGIIDILLNSYIKIIYRDALCRVMPHATIGQQMNEFGLPVGHQFNTIIIRNIDIPEKGFYMDNIDKVKYNDNLIKFLEKINTQLWYKKSKI